MSIMYRDKDDKELELMEWAKLVGDNDYRRIGIKRLWWGGVVSTVWIGVNMSFGDIPLYFETMVFGYKRYILDQRRYGNKYEAVGGHKLMIRKWNNPLYWLFGWVLLYKEVINAN